jgi:YD repeat-containing protein
MTDANGHSTQYTVDSNNGNITQVTLPTGLNVKATYDQNTGDLLSTTDERGLTTTFSQFDSFGNPRHIDRQTGGGDTVSTDITYDARSRVTSVKDTLGPTTTTTYDAMDRVVSTTSTDPAGISDSVTQATQYFADGMVASESTTTGAGDQTYSASYTYDGLDRMSQVQETASGAGTFSHTYSYDFNSNLKTETDRRGVKTTYGYNDLNFLTSAVVTGGFGAQVNAAAITPDLVGNPQSVLAQWELGRRFFSISDTGKSLLLEPAR